MTRATVLTVFCGLMMGLAFSLGAFWGDKQITVTCEPVITPLHACPNRITWASGNYLEVPPDGGSQ